MMKNPLLALALLGLFLTGCSAFPAQTLLGDTLQAAKERSTIALFERSNPSVVCIHADDQPEDEFGTVASGTGFLWDKQGHIITTQHLIAGYKTLTVSLADQRTLDADVVGFSKEYDIAVLKLRSLEDLPPPAVSGNSTNLKVGQSVFIIGNAFDLGRSFTTGIISALGRDFGDPQTDGIRDLIQTDAAINPGSSGAPLLDRQGHVIGVNVAIYSLSGGSEGIGFAVPIDAVKSVIPRLLAGDTG